ncbi:MAG: hypothetical protein AAFX65_13195 [Cyanobacteria bacterium J06638_7]
MDDPLAGQNSNPTDRSTADDPCSSPRALQPVAAAEPLLCQHCGRTAGNGISCQGFCVADSGY